MDITKEMIADCVSDLSVNGKYSRFYQMLIDEIERQISSKQLNSMIDILNRHTGLDCRKMSKPEILFRFSKLV